MNWICFILVCILSLATRREMLYGRVPPAPIHFVPHLTKDGGYCHTCYRARWWAEDYFQGNPCICHLMNHWWENGWRPADKRIWITERSITKWLLGE